MRKRLLITILAAQSLLLGACHSSEVTLALDAGSEGFDAAGPWGCLNQPPEVTTASPVTITFEMFDAIYPVTTAGPTGGSDFTVISFDPLPGVSIEACDPGDLLCSAPVTPIVTTEDAGVATLSVPGNFTGFFKFTAAGYLPSYTYQGNFLADASTLTPPAAMLAPPDAITLAGSLDAIVDLDAGSSVGLVFFEVYDCFNRHGAGVQFALFNRRRPHDRTVLSRRRPSERDRDADRLGRRRGRSQRPRRPDDHHRDARGDEPDAREHRHQRSRGRHHVRLGTRPDSLMRTPLLIATVAAQSLLVGACHSSDVTPTPAPDAGSEEFDAASPWACLDQPPQVTTSSPVAITFRDLRRAQPGHDRELERRLRLVGDLLRPAAWNRGRSVRSP